jgi:hypothetical protein
MEYYILHANIKTNYNGVTLEYPAAVPDPKRNTNLNNGIVNVTGYSEIIPCSITKS